MINVRMIFLERRNIKTTPRDEFRVKNIRYNVDSHVQTVFLRFLRFIKVIERWENGVTVQYFIRDVSGETEFPW